MAEPTHRARGVVWSLLASALFGLVFYASGVVEASPEVVFGWRMIVTAACYAAMLATPASRRALRDLGAVLVSSWRMPLVLVVTAGVVGVQMWLFSWAPVHGHGLDASLGYLLLPIALVLVGRVVFREHVTVLQWCAVGLAVVAVALNVVMTAAVSWVTFTICLGYALYFSLRKRFGLTGPAMFGLEVALLCPAAVALVVAGDPLEGTSAGLAVLGVALAATVAMTAYLAAAQSLSMPVFGLLSYVEPVLLFVAALLLGEQLHGGGAVVYVILAVALALLAVDGFDPSRRPRPRRSAPSA